jgi:hypothetical protein
MSIPMKNKKYSMTEPLPWINLAGTFEHVNNGKNEILLFV